MIPQIVIYHEAKRLYLGGYMSLFGMKFKFWTSKKKKACKFVNRTLAMDAATMLKLPLKSLLLQNF